MRLRTEDCLSIGLCTRGQARFCRQHDIDFRRFLAEGIPVEEFEGIDDLNLTRALAQAAIREQEAENGR